MRPLKIVHGQRRQYSISAETIQHLSGDLLTSYFLETENWDKSRHAILSVILPRSHLYEGGRDVKPFQHGSDLRASAMDDYRVHTTLTEYKQNASTDLLQPL